ncbi:MAG: hypothetical protein ACYC0I_10200 [Acidimicrobiales bacterium]
MPDNIDPAARPTRCILNVEEKLDLLTNHEACKPGTKGAFARREGVYSSQLTEWRRTRDAGTFSRTRCDTFACTRTPGGSRAGERENERVKKKNQQLQAELERTRMALDIVRLWRILHKWEKRTCS